MDSEVKIRIGGETLDGSLAVPDGAVGLVIFAHGSGSGRMSPRNTYIVEELNNAGLATLLFDLMTEEEDRVYENRFDIELLTDRLVGATKWCMDNAMTADLKIGYFGSSTGAAAALSASAYYGTKIKAVVSRGGRPDLTGDELDLIESPTLLIVGGEDKEIIVLNRQAYSHMGSEKKMEIIPGATHLFEEEGALERVADLAINWFIGHFALEEKTLTSQIKQQVATVGKEN
ncbi:MAG: Dienelactone hydrolase [Candidatus Collierbacteria bacterium GW2011_GWF1_44_12]|uniref:Dienelactone hydrolase n=4 Tax=Candidatus Collieribacteriota TaxID=1752725 RepID=A0A0G1PAJ4_9BACT|nr:MAG: Dienelactone hydrolase [Candidatus Collierbacteria bacterium GW2011_GWA1_44_12]KKT39365.1 MAG: Dienelactone hydrolase [Candidatus Collierbacteria bacterium GW2011_GWF1_44_12]KKT99274.1 MAG: Dienelactone hydrolase [Candidatus Collierbacteria bacterium GW2011_GWC2_45_15]KKU29781.1 MAG: Dienelactone hydrolase [Candidatus Collierbacteria bacterium GW2011_GWE1_46_18]